MNIDESTSNNGLIPNIISEEIFNQEMELCKTLSVANEGKCGWGVCKDCGVIPLLYKLHKAQLLEKEEDIAKIKETIKSSNF